MTDFLVNISSINGEYVASLPSVQCSEDACLPETSGVYFVYILIPHVQMLYVGKSQNLSLRFRSHSLMPTFKIFAFGKVDIRISFIELPDWKWEDTGILEMTLIRKLKPVFNLDHNPGNKKVFNTNNLPTSFQANSCEENRARFTRKTKTRKSPLGKIPNYQIIGTLEDKVIRDLKKDASALGVYRYSVMTKEELITAIRKILEVQKQ